MRILHTVEFYYPSVGGSQEVVKQLSEHLVMLGHDVTVATTKLPNRGKKVINGVKIVEFNIYGNQVRGLGGDIEAYKNFLLKSKFDVIMNYAAQQWASDIFFEVMDQVKGKKIFVPCGFSGLYIPEYKNYFRDLPNILHKYNATVYLSKKYRDINFAHQHKLKNMVIIPNGADEREFGDLDAIRAIRFRKDFGIKSDELLFLHVGTHTGVKGHKEVIQAFEQAGINNATLVIAGDNNKGDSGCLRSCHRYAWFNNYLRDTLTRQHKKIKIIHIPRDQTVSAFQAADIFLFLSNIECSPLVLFEASAAGKPFIASDCGNAQEIARWTGSGIIVKSRQDKIGYTVINVNSATKAIEKMAKNTALSLKMGRNGRRVWEKKFSWASIAKQYEQLYKSC